MNALSNKKRERLINAVLLAGIIGVFVCWFALDWYQRSKATPPKDADTLEKVAAAIPAPTTLELKQDKENVMLLWHGAQPGFPSLLSGEPIYVFDNNGRLVFGTEDSGDVKVGEANNFKALPRIRIVSLEEARHWVHERK